MLDELRQQCRVRLNGIDAPENGQAFGTVSRRNLSQLVFDRRVSVEWHKRDRYGRYVGKVVVDGVDANLEQLRDGLAWLYVRYLSEVPPGDRDTYVSAERQARKEGLGLWRERNSSPPWEWRRRVERKPSGACSRLLDATAG